MKDILSLLQDFDVANFLPEPDKFLKNLEGFMRLLVLAGPLVLLVLGAWYYFAPPKEANHAVGFRTYWGMGSVEAWRFTQGLAGVVFGALGLVMIVAMLLICGSFAEMQTMDLLWRAIYCLAGEAIAVLIACLVINIVVMIRYDGKGNERKKKAVRR